MKAAVKACIERVGLNFSKKDVHDVVTTIGSDTLSPENMVAAYFIAPLVREVARTAFREVDELLKSRAGPSGVVGYLADLPPHAKQHSGEAYWVKSYLHARCFGTDVPEELRGLTLHTPGFISATGVPVATADTKGVVKDAFLITDAARDNLKNVIEDCLGTIPDDYHAFFHATTAQHVLSVLSNPRHDVGRSKANFGPGLYLTPRAKQAMAYALTKSTKEDAPAIAVWLIPRQRFRDVTMYKLQYNREFKDTAYNAFNSEVDERWVGFEKDIVVGPVAVLRLGKTWREADYNDIFTLRLNRMSEAEADYGEQYALRTPLAIEALLNHSDVKKCAIVFVGKDASSGKTGARAGAGSGASRADDSASHEYERTLAFA